LIALKPLSPLRASHPATTVRNRRCASSPQCCRSPQVRQFDKDLRTFCFDRVAPLTMMKIVRREGHSLHIRRGRAEGTHFTRTARARSSVE
jgi:hypothetical protein